MPEAIDPNKLEFSENIQWLLEQLEPLKQVPDVDMIIAELRRLGCTPNRAVLVLMELKGLPLSTAYKLAMHSKVWDGWIEEITAWKGELMKLVDEHPELLDLDDQDEATVLPDPQD